jgi:hypothetical protein
MAVYGAHQAVIFDFKANVSKYLKIYGINKEVYGEILDLMIETVIGPDGNETYRCDVAC